jgi:endonuclease YncB( thermonuclease family)
MNWAAAVLGLLLAGSAPELVGIPHVTDGDTIRIDGTRIRLAGIDAPELRTHAGEAAKRFVLDVTSGREVSCRPTGEKSHERVVAYCSVAGEDLGLVIVRAGWAVDLAKFSKGKYRAAEEEARAAKRGMWR